MIIRKRPLNENKYIKVTSATSCILHAAGFMPKYMDNNYVYYTKSNDILDFMKSNSLNTIDRL